MAPNSGSDREAQVAAIEQEKGRESPVVNNREVEAVFDIDSQDLPSGYYLRRFFLGTLIASGLSMSAVSTPADLQIKS